MEEMVALFLPFCIFISYLRLLDGVYYVLKRKKNERNNNNKRRYLRKKNYFCILNPMIRG